MREIRRLTESDFDTYISIAINAFPGGRAADEDGRRRLLERVRQRENDPIINIYGLFEDGAMRGAMRLYDFTMNLHGRQTLVGGVGGVVVDLRHKKEKVAYDMMQFFLHHYREKKACLTTLYPFRPDFYKQMGFGYGRKINQYRVKPASLPRGPSKANVTFLTNDDKSMFNDCYNRVLAKTHGFMAYPDSDLDTIFATDGLKAVAYKEDGQIRGYLLFRFLRGRANHFLSNDIVVQAMIYETPAARQALFTFLHTQADQIDRVVFNTQEEDFHLILHDPRNDSGHLIPSGFHESNTQGVGLMYRVIDIPRLFEVLRHHNFGGQSCRLQITIADSFLPQNTGSWIVGFENGRAQIQSPQEPADVEIKLDVAEFSSLVMGVTDFKRLFAYGLAHISDESALETVHQLFYTDRKPICLTAF